MKRTSAIALILGFSVTANAAIGELPKELSIANPCEPVILKLLSENHVTWDWTRQVDPAPGLKLFRSPTDRLGRWVELREDSIRILDSKRTRTYEFVSGSGECKATSKETPTRGLPVLGIKGFSDRDLEKLLARKSKALIYVWSPRMVYSLTFLDVFRRSAEKKGLQFIALMDPLVQPRVAELAAAKAKVALKGPESDRALASSSDFDHTRKLASFELFMRNPTIHFPTSFVIANGRIAPMRILGVKPDSYIEANIDRMVGSVK